MYLEDHWQGATLTMPSGEEIKVDINLCSKDGDMTISIYPITERGTIDTKDSMLSVTISDNLPLFQPLND